MLKHYVLGRKRERGDTRATQPPPSNVVTSIWAKFLKGREGERHGGKKLKSGMEAKAIALRKASEGNNIAEEEEGVTLETSTPL